MKQYKEKAAELIKNKLLEEIPGDDLPFFINYFKKKFGNNLLAVIHYGSLLSEKTKKNDSFRDFFIIIDDFTTTTLPAFDKLLSSFLPPNLYYFEEEENNKKYICKYNVISVNDFKEYVNINPPDNYIAGRFSKRMALLYYKNDNIVNIIATGMAEASIMTAEKSIFMMNRPLTKKELIILFLSLSYMAEERLEDFSVKSSELYIAEIEYYNKLYGEIIINYLINKKLIICDYGTGVIWLKISQKVFEKEHNNTLIYLNNTKTRTKLRWPKMLVTVDKWIEQLQGKLERTHGIKIKIPDWERKVIFITGWRYYFKILKHVREKNRNNMRNQ